jgi:hypothetical protein
MGNQKKKRTESRIFSNHKKVGKIFVPPMRQYLDELGTVSDLTPKNWSSYNVRKLSQ